MDFLWLGVLLERIGQTARILDMHYHIQGAAEGHQPLLQTALWLSLLRACSGFEAFMRKQQGRVSRDAAISFLLFEGRFPRSLRYCVRSAMALGQRLATAGAKKGATAAVKRLETLDRALDEEEKRGIPPSLHALLTLVVDQISLACVELQQGLGADETDRRPQPEAAQ
jgi:uncharacterized alpha-E superfamily protein